MKRKEWLRLSYHLIFAFVAELKLSSPEHCALIECCLQEDTADAKWRVEAAACTTDHIHLLVSTCDDITMTKLIRLLKTRVAKCAQEAGIYSGRKFWQPGSFAISTSASEAKELCQCIATQDTLHSTWSLGDEVRRLARNAGMSRRKALPFLKSGTTKKYPATRRAESASQGKQCAD